MIEAGKSEISSLVFKLFMSACTMNELLRSGHPVWNVDRGIFVFAEMTSKPRPGAAVKDLFLRLSGDSNTRPYAW